MKADTVRYFKVDRRDLVYLKFILEAYEGMSTLSTVEKTASIVRLIIPDGFADDMQKLIDAVRADIYLTEVTESDSGKGAVEFTTPNSSEMTISS
jgi:hypothetical protein